MIEQSFFDSAFDRVISDLPWSLKRRLVIGDLISRESFKDELLLRQRGIPAQAVVSLRDIAVEIASASTPVAPALNSLSQADAVQIVGKDKYFQEVLGDFVEHLGMRQIAQKVARAITEFDFQFTDSLQAEALLDQVAEKDKRLHSLLEFFLGLWRKGIFYPWSDAPYYRSAIEILEGNEAQLKFEEIEFLGLGELRPVEARFVELLMAKVKRPIKTDLSIASSKERNKPFFCVESIHSSSDELQFLKERVLQATEAGIAPSDIGIAVPNENPQVNSIYKRKLRKILDELGVGMQDPTLVDSWKEDTASIWWVKFFKVIARGYPLQETLELISNKKTYSEILALAFKLGLDSGHKFWIAVSREEFSKNILELPAILQSAQTFTRSLSLDAWVELFELDSIEASLPNSDSLREFASHLKENRLLLSHWKGRIQKLVPYFEEFLQVRSRSTSIRNRSGVWVVNHGVWIPKSLKEFHVLNARTFTASIRREEDLWSGVFAIPNHSSIERAFETSLAFHKNVVLYFTEYNFLGADVQISNFWSKIFGETKKISGGLGHVKTGWDAEQKKSIESEKMSLETLDAQAVQTNLTDFAIDGKLSVSAFEDYLTCPFLFYGRHVLKLNPAETLDLVPDAKSRGLVLHKILETLMRKEIAEAPELRLCGSLKWKTWIESEMRKILEDLPNERLKGLYRDPALRNRFQDGLKAQLSRWVDWEMSQIELFPNRKPMFLEHPFELTLDGFVLRGKIDRVDSDGSSSVVIDYKSGAGKFSGKEIISGLGVQLLSYSEAVFRSVGLESAAGFYLTIGRTGVEARKGFYVEKFKGKVFQVHGANKGIVKEKSFAELMSETIPIWTGKLNELKTGKFTASPARTSDCRNCSYQGVCGFEQEVD